MLRPSIRARRFAAGAVCVSLAIILFRGALSCETLRAGDDRSPAVSGDHHRPTDAGEARARATRAERQRVAKALDRAVDASKRFDGELEVAVMLDDSTKPIARATSPHGTTRRMRAWSMSKMLSAIALYRALGWGEQPGKALPDRISVALTRAIRRSENCRQRRVVIELQDVSGGMAGAANEIERVLALARADNAVVASQSQGPDAVCIPYLTTQAGLTRPRARTLMLGTSTWTVQDAARFAHALGSGVYGRALSSELLRLMRRPKERSTEGRPEDFTAPVDWGAGAAFRPIRVAYKAGWGGSQQGAFFAGQIAIVQLPGGNSAGVAVMFHPHEQPTIDDPGLTTAPAAVTQTMRILARALSRG